MIKDTEAIILDGEQKSALSAARSLGARGIRVITGSARKTAMTLYSRHTSETFLYPSPLEDKENFVLRMIEMCASRKEKPVLFAFSDATFLPLSRSREKILKVAHFMLPSRESIETAFDKSRTMELARRLDIPIPKTLILKTEADIKKNLHLVRFPAVVKPRHSVSWKALRGVQGSVIFAQNRSHLGHTVTSIQKETGELPIIEEYISGEEWGVEIVAKNGEVLQWFAHRRIRSLAPTGGASVVKESMILPPDLKVHSEKLIKKLVWNGVAMIEFKRDQTRGNQALLLEINGRFWGSLPLAVRSGIDFPYLYFRLAQGEGEQVAPQIYTAGVITRHFLGDVKHLLSVFFSRDAMRAHAFPSRGKALKDFFSPPPRTHDDVFSLSDPKPFFAEIVDRLL